MFEACQVVLRAPTGQILHFNFRDNFKNKKSNQDNGNHTYLQYDYDNSGSISDNNSSPRRIV